MNARLQAQAMALLFGVQYSLGAARRSGAELPAAVGDLDQRRNAGITSAAKSSSDRSDCSQVRSPHAKLQMT